MKKNGLYLILVVLVMSACAVIEVYDNLLRGSIKHLQAFVRTYERQTGDIYQPQFFSQEEYQELLSLSTT